MPNYSIIDYVMLHEKATEGIITNKEFKTEYKKLQKEDSTIYNDKEKNVIKELYKDIVSFSIF